MEQNKYYIENIESGIPYQVSKETYDRYIEFKNYMASLMNPKLKGLGRPIIIGTGGEIEKNNYKELFYNSENFKIKDEDGQ